LTFKCEPAGVRTCFCATRTVKKLSFIPAEARQASASGDRAHGSAP
jgi:hypothetical protein